MISNKQRFIKNLGFLYLSRIIIIIFSLLINIIIIKRLGSSVYGDFAFGLTFVQYFIIFADLGLSQYGMIEVSNNIENVNFIVNNIVSANIILSTFSFIVILFLVNILKFGHVQKEILYVFAFLPLINSISVSWAITGLEKNFLFSISNLIGKTLYITLLYLLVLDKSYYFLAAIILLGSNFIISLIQFLYIRKFIASFRFGLNKFWITLKKGLPFGIMSGLFFIYGSLPILFLKIFNTNKDIGYYYISYKFIFFIFTLFHLMSNASLPVIKSVVNNKDINKEKNIINELLRFGYTFAIPASFGIFAISHNLINLILGIKFIFVAHLLKIMAISIIFGTLGSIMIGYLTVKNLKTGIIKVGLLSSLYGLISGYLLIRYFGIYGAAILFLSIELVVMLLLIFITKSQIKMEINLLNLIKVVLSASLMAIIVIILNQGLILSIIIGAAVYFILSLVLKTITKKDLNEIKTFMASK